MRIQKVSYRRTRAPDQKRGSSTEKREARQKKRRKKEEKHVTRRDDGACCFWSFRPFCFLLLPFFFPFLFPIFFHDHDTLLTLRQDVVQSRSDPPSRNTCRVETRCSDRLMMTLRGTACNVLFSVYLYNVPCCSIFIIIILSSCRRDTPAPDAEPHGGACKYTGKIR